jgi:hypothetical protein
LIAGKEKKEIPGRKEWGKWATERKKVFFTEKKKEFWGQRKKRSSVLGALTQEIFHQGAIEALENLSFNWVLLFFSL